MASILGKKPFLDKILSSCSADDLSTLTSLVDNPGTPTIIYLYGNDRLLNSNHIGVNYVQLMIDEYSRRYLNGFLIYIDNTHCGFFSFTGNSSHLVEIEINPATLAYVDIYENLTAEEFRRTLFDITGGSGGGSADFNMSNGIGENSVQQKNNEGNHAKGGTAIGDSSASFGVGDTYEFSFSVSGTTLTLSESANPNWQNMVLKYGDEYKRIVEVSGNTITLESALSKTSGTITASIINQVAMGDSSFSCGMSSQAFGVGSLASGIACKAVGDGSVAGGYFSLVNQSYGIAVGDHAISAGIGQAVFGKWNNVNFNDLLVVGNGSSSSKSDAFIVRTDGRATIGKNPDNSMDVATKSYVDGVGHLITITAFQVEGVNTVELSFILVSRRTTAYLQTDLYNYFTQGQTLPNDTYVRVLGNTNNNKYYFLGVRSGGFRVYEHDLPNNVINRSIITSFADTPFELIYE